MGGIPVQTQRKLIELDRAQALGLLARASFGRVVFTIGGLPTVRPLNHVVVDEEVIVHTRGETAFAKSVLKAGGLVVAYQADEIDPHGRLGWSVVVSGTAYVVDDPSRAKRLARQVRTWIDHPVDTVIAIKPQVVSGFRLTFPKLSTPAAADGPGGARRFAAAGAVDDVGPEQVAHGRTEGVDQAAEREE